MEIDDAILKGINLYKIYETDGFEIPVIKGVSISVYPSDKLAIIGPSGSGKTTLVNILTGHIKPSAGQVFWDQDNHEINKLSKFEMTKLRRKFLGFITQENLLVPYLTVKENIMLDYNLTNKKVDDLQDLYRKIMKILNITHLEKRKVFNLSRGEAKRVNIASALITNPKILVADEPVVNLDPYIAREILELFDEINEDFGTALLITTHDQSVAEKNKRIIELQDGILLGAHSNILDLDDLEKSRKISVDSLGRILIPSEVLQKLNYPNLFTINLSDNSLILSPDFSSDDLVHAKPIRECQNCLIKTIDEFCSICGYQTIVVK